MLANNLPTSARQLSQQSCFFMTPNQRIFQMSLRVLLGDCSPQKNNTKSQERYRLRFLQGEKHKQYIVHLHQGFKECVISPPFYDLKRKTCSFQTFFEKSFKPLADIFCNEERKKTVGPFFVKNKISPTLLPYWFMDNGGLLSYNKDYRRRGLVFNTQGFTSEQVHIFSQNLNPG